MNVVQKYKIIEKGAIMHLLFNENMPKIPYFVPMFFLQCVFALFAPLYYPAAQETFDLCVRALMTIVTVLLMLIITSFVVTVLRITYIKDLAEREALKNQYRLSVGDVESIAAAIQTDCLIVQKEGETAAQYLERLEAAKQYASKTFWVLSIAKGSRHIMAYLHPIKDARIIERNLLAWETDLPLDQRIVAVGYDFSIETQENYGKYVRYFVEGWLKHGATFKIATFDGDPQTQTIIAERNVIDNTKK